MPTIESTRTHLRRRARTIAAAGAALFALGCGAAFAATTPAPSLTTPPPPPPVQTLLAHTAALRISSERFSETSSATRTITLHGKDAHGHTHTRRVNRSYSFSTSGEVDLAAQTAATFEGAGASRHPGEIVIGSTFYLYNPQAAHVDGGRPWVRSPTEGVFTAASLLPFHGGERSERNAGGTGPYAGLLNLIATAAGAVTVGAPTTVHGQPAVELTATVDPFQLLEMPPKELAELKPVVTPELMHAYLSEAGQPLRVVTGHVSGILASLTTTTDTLAVDVPVTVKAPLARLTITQAALIQAERRHKKK